MKTILAVLISASISFFYVEYKKKEAPSEERLNSYKGKALEKKDYIEVEYWDNNYFKD